jgi:hypothetical protein
MGTVNEETLLDYLLSELDTDEVSSIDRELLRSPSLRNDLAGIQKVLGKVSLLNEEIEPPKNLTQKTVARVFAAVCENSSCEDSPAVPDEVILFPLIRSEKRSDSRTPLSPCGISHRLSRRTVPFIRRNAPLIPEQQTAKPPIADQNVNHISKRRYTELLASAAAGILIAMFIFPLIRFTGSQIQTYVTQSKIHKINKNLNTYSQLADTGVLPRTQLAENPAEPVSTDLTAANWQEVVPAKVPLLNVGSNSPSTVYLVSSPVFQDNGTDSQKNSTLAAQNPPDILYLGQTPEKVEQVELNHRDIDYQTLMSKINGTVSLMNGQKQSNPTVQTVSGQNVLLQNGKVFFRELPVFVQQKQ